MTERPILFSGPMIRAILSGTKTQTRRIVKGAWHEAGGYLQSDPEGDGGEWCFGCSKVSASFLTRCPHGGEGDALWVRETHLKKASGTIYRADFDPTEAAGLGGMYGGWKPSIFMLRAASRITLQITGVCVERLQAISGKDILKEGAVARAQHDEYLGKMPVSAFDGKAYVDLQSLWAAGWNSINAKRGYGWDQNPWVWRVEFRRHCP